jgi:hypothetical protein
VHPPLLSLLSSPLCSPLILGGWVISLLLHVLYFRHLYKPLPLICFQRERERVFRWVSHIFFLFSLACVSYDAEKTDRQASLDTGRSLFQDEAEGYSILGVRGLQREEGTILGLYRGSAGDLACSTRLGNSRGLQWVLSFEFEQRLIHATITGKNAFSTSPPPI